MSAPPTPPLLVAIDGPSGVGKGTVARRVAARLGIPYFDTGAMYRALALAVLEAGVDPREREAVLAVARREPVGLALEAGALAVLLEDRPVGERIRSPEVSAATSVISTYPEVRRRMVELQRRWGRRFGGVMEGRDIGTVVFPDSRSKIFLDARPEVRAERRFRQLREAGREVSREDVAAEVERRDRRDTTREDSPLRCDESYTRIETSELTIEEVVERVLEAVERRRHPET